MAADRSMGEVRPQGAAAIIKLEFEGQPFDGLLYKGQPVWPARMVGARLGYARGGAPFVEKVRASDEFVDGVHVLRLGGARAREIRALLGDLEDTESVSPRKVGVSGGVDLNPQVVLLTEAGVFLGALLTKKPEGRRLRAWLSEVVLPALRRGESVSLATTERTRRVELASLPRDEQSSLSALIGRAWRSHAEARRRGDRELERETYSIAMGLLLGRDVEMPAERQLDLWDAA